MKGGRGKSTLCPGCCCVCLSAAQCRTHPATFQHFLVFPQNILFLPHLHMIMVKLQNGHGRGKQQARWWQFSNLANSPHFSLACKVPWSGSGLEVILAAASSRLKRKLNIFIKKKDVGLDELTKLRRCVREAFAYQKFLFFTLFKRPLTLTFTDSLPTSTDSLLTLYWLLLTLYWPLLTSTDPLSLSTDFLTTPAHFLLTLYHLLLTVYWLLLTISCLLLTLYWLSTDFFWRSTDFYRLFPDFCWLF